MVSVTVPNPRFSSGSWSELNWNQSNEFHPNKSPNDVKQAVSLAGSTNSSTQNFASNWVFEFWLCHNIIYMYKMEFYMLLHLPFCNLRSDQYSLGRSSITVTIGRFSQWRKEYWSDSKLQKMTWKNMRNCIFYTYIILHYNQNSNT